MKFKIIIISSKRGATDRGSLFEQRFVIFMQMLVFAGIARTAVFINAGSVGLHEREDQDYENENGHASQV